MDDKIGNKMQEVIDRIVKGKWIGVLQKCENPNMAIDILISLMPETVNPEKMKLDPLFKCVVYYLQRVYGLDLRACKDLIIKGDKQLCGAVGEREKCDHDILSTCCEHRDSKRHDSPPTSEALRYYGTCAGL